MTDYHAPDEHDDVRDREYSDSPFCTCEAIHTMEELDWGRCDACGGLVDE